MTARRIATAALMLALGTARAEDAAAGVSAGGHPDGAAGAPPARAVVSQRFLDGFWATVPAEEPVPAAPAAAPDAPAVVEAPIPSPAAPVLQLCAVPAWRRWLLPYWSCCAAAAMLAGAAALALAGALRGIWLELRHPRRLRQLAAVKKLRSWRNTPAPTFAGLLQAFREFYQLPAGCDADAIAAVVGKSDADLAQAILAMDRQRFAPSTSLAGESAANAPAEASAICPLAVETAATAGAGIAHPAHPVHPVCALLSRWRRHQPPMWPGRAAAVAAALLAVVAVLSLAVVIVAVRDLARRDGFAPAWNRALQLAAEQQYHRAYDAFLALERVSPSSPELSRNLAVLAAVTGHDEHARAWRRHALIQEQLFGSIRLAGRDRRWPIAVPALLLVMAIASFWVAAMGWPGTRRAALAWRAWLSLPLALFACSVLLLVGHWRQCRLLQQLAVVATAQPLLVTPGEATLAQAPRATPPQALAATGLGDTAGSTAPLAQLTAGDCVALQRARGEWCFVSVNGTTGWLTRSAILPFRL